MRQIKFRFWNTILNRMEDSYWDDMDGMDLDMVFNPKINGGRIPMQFTGLHDRNGKGVYEGDMLIDSFYDETPIVIEFKGGCFVGVIDSKEINNRNWLSFEVVGNIYENHE